MGFLHLERSNYLLAAFGVAGGFLLFFFNAETFEGGSTVFVLGGRHLSQYKGRQG
jgi:hypothetical protein